ncbi:hypothetical protein HFO43_02340 [Rhizobium leguminosarum]|uniref:hypothetical protein n=1 Tax=Rhizobium leguminosarum TaxID=384 RepID=UPI001C94B114|nr:hypothetical protein [Rhizobium leguminosarum]MBY5667417.1 hypothetical protein [Rhizobium leguminosarum]
MSVETFANSKIEGGNHVRADTAEAEYQGQFRFRRYPTETPREQEIQLIDELFLPACVVNSNQGKV